MFEKPRALAHNLRSRVVFSAVETLLDGRATGLVRTFERSDFLGQKIVDDVAKFTAFFLCNPL